MYGFGFVWESQGVGNARLFIKVFKQRLIDCFAQNWHSAIASRDMYTVYSSIKNNLVPCDYLTNVCFIKIRKTFSRFRVGMSPLRSHFLKYRDFEKNVDIYCPFCIDLEETEIHLLFVCPAYADLRAHYIPAKYSRRPSLFRMSLLLSSKCSATQKRVSLFIFKALSERQRRLCASVDQC